MTLTVDEREDLQRISDLTRHSTLASDEQVFKLARGYDTVLNDLDAAEARIQELEIAVCNDPSHWGAYKRGAFTQRMDLELPLPPKHCSKCGHDLNTHFTTGEPKV